MSIFRKSYTTKGKMGKKGWIVRPTCAKRSKPKKSSVYNNLMRMYK